MIKFVRFHEVNDWEGESWNFWLQLTGNEDEIGELDELLKLAEKDCDYDFAYTLFWEDQEREEVVDKLVMYAHEGYMDSDNKVTGKFVCPADIGEYGDYLYKGGIGKYFE